MNKIVTILLLSLMGLVSSCSKNKALFSKGSWMLDSKHCLVLGKNSGTMFQYDLPNKQKNMNSENLSDHIISEENGLKSSPRYQIIQRSLRAIPVHIDSICFIVNDTYIVATLDSKHVKWLSDYESWKYLGKYTFYGNHIYGRVQKEIPQLSKGLIWRNLIKVSKYHIVCVDRVKIEGKHLAIIYIILSDRKGKTPGALWDVGRFENLELLSPIIDHKRKMTEKTIELNSGIN